MEILTDQTAAVKKANSMLGVIRKGVADKSVNIILPPDKSMVQLHLE